MSSIKWLDRWSWFRNHTGRQTFEPAIAPTVGNFTEYNDWLLNGLPPSALRARFQQDVQTPLAVEWEIIADEGVFAPVGPPSPECYATFWGGVDTVDDTQVAAIWVKWSTAGVTRWRLADLSSRGTIVIPACDWCEVYAITCQSEVEEGVVLPPMALPVRICVRPAEQNEASNARCSIAPFTFTQAAALTVLAFTGPQGRLNNIRFAALDVGTATTVVVSFLRSDMVKIGGLLIASFGSASGRGPSVAEAAVPWQVPSQTTYYQFSAGTAGGTVTMSVMQDIE